VPTTCSVRCPEGRLAAQPLLRTNTSWRRLKLWRAAKAVSRATTPRMQTQASGVRAIAERTLRAPPIMRFFALTRAAHSEKQQGA